MPYVQMFAILSATGGIGMPQFDRRRSLDVPVEFEPNETLTSLPKPDRFTLALVTDGRANVTLNGATAVLKAPCALCLSPNDRLVARGSGFLSAQSFSLSPEFLKMRGTFKLVRGQRAPQTEEAYEKDALSLFVERNEGYLGVLELPPQIAFKAFEWLSVIGTEIIAQSDGQWTCRIRRYFLQIVNLLDRAYEGAGESDAERTAADDALEYLHANYMEVVTLDGLCAAVHMNRTTLNRKFRALTGVTAMEYLLNYRLQIAREMLAHTGLTIEEIAQATGFSYGTYLIRRFTARMGMAPTAYRREARKKHNIPIPKR